eukprot:m51a1_g9169 putative domain containing protein (934) ;mRNA; r:22695-26387
MQHDFVLASPTTPAPCCVACGSPLSCQRGQDLKCKGCSVVCHTACSASLSTPCTSPRQRSPSLSSRLSPRQSPLASPSPPPPLLSAPSSDCLMRPSSAGLPSSSSPPDPRDKTGATDDAPDTCPHRAGRSGSANATLRPLPQTPSAAARQPAGGRQQRPFLVMHGPTMSLPVLVPLPPASAAPPPPTGSTGAAGVFQPPPVPRMSAPAAPAAAEGRGDSDIARAAAESPRAVTMAGPLSMAQKRAMAVMELIESEKTYIDHLMLIITVFVIPMRERKILSEDQINAVFCGVENLLPVNTELLRSLEEGTSVGQSFLKVADYLKMYSNYCSNVDNQNETVVKLRKCNPQFDTFVYEASRLAVCKKQDLGSYLIKPVQRLCKYPLLIREIIRNTELDDPAMKELEQAFEKVNAVCLVVNQKKKDDESRFKVFDLQERLVNKYGKPLLLLVDAAKKLRLQGNLQERAFGHTSGSPQSVSCFLFNDSFLRAHRYKLSSKKLAVESDTPIELVNITDIPEGEHSKLGVSPKQNACIVSLGNGGEEGDIHLLLFFDSEKDKSTWMFEIMSAKSLEQERNRVFRRPGSADDDDDEAKAAMRRIFGIKEMLIGLCCPEAKQMDTDLNELVAYLHRYKGRRHSKFCVKARLLARDIEAAMPDVKKRIAKKKSVSEIFEKLHLTYLAAKAYALSDLRTSLVKEKEAEMMNATYLDEFEDDEGREFWIANFMNKEEVSRDMFMARLGTHMATQGLATPTESETAALLEDLDTNKDGNVSATEFANFTDLLGLSRQLQRIKGLPFEPDAPADPLPESTKDAKCIVAWIDDTPDVGKGMQAVLSRRSGTVFVSFTSSRAYAVWLRAHGAETAPRLRVVTTFRREADGGDRAADRVVRYTRKIVPEVNVPVLAFSSKAEHELAKRLEDPRRAVSVGHDADTLMAFLQ